MRLISFEIIICCYNIWLPCTYRLKRFWAKLITICWWQLKGKFLKWWIVIKIWKVCDDRSLGEFWLMQLTGFRLSEMLRVKRSGIRNLWRSGAEMLRVKLKRQYWSMLLSFCLWPPWFVWVLLKALRSEL